MRGVDARGAGWHRLCYEGIVVIDPVHQSDNYQLARRLLDAAVLRHEAIATNIANAETPGFRRLDVAPDFSANLRAAVEQRGAGLDLAALRPRLMEDQSARTIRPDGNSVEIERELLAMNRNTVEYDYLSEVVSNNLKQLRQAVTGRVA
jgi:flagellar basal-body rod protein FlgB